MSTISFLNKSLSKEGLQPLGGQGCRQGRLWYCNLASLTAEVQVAVCPSASLFRAERNPRAGRWPLVYLPVQYQWHQVISERQSPPIFKCQKRIFFNTPDSYSLSHKTWPGMSPQAVHPQFLTVYSLFLVRLPPERKKNIPPGSPEPLHGSCSWAREHHWGFLPMRLRAQAVSVQVYGAVT